jgi:dTDP-4-dehydrorhamnose 3,5-epimerase
MIEPHALTNSGFAVDDRGRVAFCNNLEGFEIKRFYQVTNHRQGFVRAWHGHQFEQKLVYVVEGAVVLKLVPAGRGMGLRQDRGKIKTFNLSADKPQAILVPQHYYNGFKTLTPSTKVMFFSDRTLEESMKDDYRQPWDHFGDGIWHILQR